MTCEACREILSARLDGEDRPGEADAAEKHLVGCDACAEWLDHAARVTRLARLSLVPSSALDVGGFAISGGGKATKVAVVQSAARWVLGALGAAQFILGMVQLSTLGDASHAHLDGASPTHLLHESAAWNIAIGAGFGWTALRRTRPAGLIPLLSAFVLMLVLLSADDFTAGGVDGVRLASHLIVVVGYAVVLVLAKVGDGGGEPGADRAGRPIGGPWTTSASTRVEPRPATGRPPLRLVPRVVTSAGPAAARWDGARWDDEERAA